MRTISGLSGILLRLAAIAILGFPFLALDCSDSPTSPNADPPAITLLPGTYVVDMTFKSRTGGTGGCPSGGHRFESVVLQADPAAETITLQFTFPVSGRYDSTTGAFVGSGRGDSSSPDFDNELVIDGVFSLDRNDEVTLTGEAAIRLLFVASGVEFCKTLLDVRMERSAP